MEIARARELKAGMCLSRSVELFKAQFTLVFAATLLIWVASASIGAVPFVGIFLSSAIHGVLYGGLYAFFLKLIRGQKAEIPDAFSGFSSIFPQLLLGGGATGLITMFAVLLVSAPFLIAIVPTILIFVDHPKSAFPILPVLLGMLAVLAAILTGLFFSVMWVFTVPLIMDRKMEFWPAMELSRKVAFSAPRQIAAVLIVAGIVAVSGIVLCGVGLLFTMPIGFGAVAYAYEDIFGARES